MSHFTILHSEYTRDNSLFVCNKCFKYRKEKWCLSTEKEDCLSCFIPDPDPKRWNDTIGEDRELLEKLSV